MRMLEMLKIPLLTILISLSTVSFTSATADSTKVVPHVSGPVAKTVPAIDSGASTAQPNSDSTILICGSGSKKKAFEVEAPVNGGYCTKSGGVAQCFDANNNVIASASCNGCATSSGAGSCVQL